jgi:hypothetical protein
MARFESIDVTGANTGGVTRPVSVDVTSTSAATVS